MEQSIRCERAQVFEIACPVRANDAVNAEYRHLVLDAPEAAEMARPGQFFHLLCPGAGGDQPFLRRPMSIYRIDRAAGRLEFLYKVVGKGTRSLSRLRPGEALNIMGPLGQGFDLDRGQRHILQVARGVGLATLAPVAEAARARGIRTTAILSARRADLVMSVDYLRGVGAEVIAVTDDAGTSDIAHVERLARRVIDQEGGDYIVTCGSNRLLTLCRSLAWEYGIGGAVALEQSMGCGIGMCFACVREFTGPDGRSTYRRVCWDGPVFDIGEVRSW